jgi:hypothetical protein
MIGQRGIEKKMAATTYARGRGAEIGGKQQTGWEQAKE